MFNIIYHKTYKETKKIKCVTDDVYTKELDYVEWFPNPSLEPKKNSEEVLGCCESKVMPKLRHKGRPKKIEEIKDDC